MYTITDEARLYEFAPFTIVPFQCSASYSITVDPPEGGIAVSLNNIPSSPSIQFEYSKDLNLSGNTFKEYKITVRGEAGLTSK